MPTSQPVRHSPWVELFSATPGLLPLPCPAAKNVTALRRNPRRALGQRTTYTRQTILKACGWSRWAGAIPADANMAAGECQSTAIASRGKRVLSQPAAPVTVAAHQGAGEHPPRGSQKQSDSAA